jgi:hypothetical protein
MSRVRIAPAEPSRETIESEIAQLRELDAATLRMRWQMVFRKPAPTYPAISCSVPSPIGSRRMFSVTLMARAGVCSTAQARPTKFHSGPYKRGAPPSCGLALFLAGNGMDVSIA